jgi:hypothetical protein
VISLSVWLSDESKAGVFYARHYAVVLPVTTMVDFGAAVFDGIIRLDSEAAIAAPHDQADTGRR